MKFVLLTIAGMALMGCASHPGVTGNSVYVGVGPVWTEDDAYPYAEAHCEQYGKSARFHSGYGVRYTFDCI